MSINSVMEDKTPKGFKYPILKINKEKGFVVLFSSRGEGFIVHSFHDENLKEYGVGCLNVWDEESFEVFHGQVTLSNK